MKNQNSFPLVGRNLFSKGLDLRFFVNVGCGKWFNSPVLWIIKKFFCDIIFWYK